MNTKSVELTTGKGGLPLVKITTPWSTAEIYLLGAHVTHFQKNGEPPLLFMSGKSWFAAGQPIRGGVPVCFPWFGPRNGEPAHGFARVTGWKQIKKSTAPDGAVTLKFRMPQIPGRDAWNKLCTEFAVTVSDKLAMELTATNESADQTLEIENCLHTYFQVGDITQVSLTGLQNAPFDDFAAGAGGARKVENDAVLRITQETNRVYPDNTSTVEIRDENLKRTICVEKFNSRSTVVWNPWTTQKLPDDFDPAEYRQIICVEAGNVKQNKISLAPGKTAALKVVLSSRPL
jgi:D-hexose-6-phosphate mutarotase